MSDPQYIPVREVMSHKPIVIDGLGTVAQAVALMRENNVSSLVVDKRDAADEYGLVTVARIAAEVVAEDRSPERVNVYEIMSKPVISVDAGMNIKYAVRLLSRLGLTRALVLDAGKVVGIATLKDLVLRSIPDG
jgi:signal-transduction protein with cAMP-binding, CBS, and nucleotidyltransferase domain